MQSVSSRIWTRVAVFISHDDNNYTTGTSKNFIAYRSSKVSSRRDCIFEIHQLLQLGFRRVYSKSCCSCLFEPEIIKIGQSFHEMKNNNILNLQKSTIILNACTKRSGNLQNSPRIYIYIYIYIYVCVCVCVCERNNRYTIVGSWVLVYESRPVLASAHHQEVFIACLNYIFTFNVFESQIYLSNVS